MKFIWHGKEVENKIKDSLRARLKMIGRQGTREIKTMIAIRVEYPKGWPRGMVFDPQLWPRPIRSKPGEPPRKDTGALQRSIGWEYLGSSALGGGRQRDIVRIGSANVKYSVTLELGGLNEELRHVAARPFLRPWLDMNLPLIKQILTAPLPRTPRGPGVSRLIG